MNKCDWCGVVITEENQNKIVTDKHSFCGEICRKNWSTGIVPPRFGRIPKHQRKKARA